MPVEEKFGHLRGKSYPCGLIYSFNAKSIPMLIRKTKKLVLNTGDVRPEEDRPGVQVSLTLSIPVMKRLIAMRRAKGMTREQPLIRIFITEGLDRGGF